MIRVMLENVSLQHKKKIKLTLLFVFAMSNKMIGKKDKVL